MYIFSNHSLVEVISLIEFYYKSFEIPTSKQVFKDEFTPVLKLLMVSPSKQKPMTFETVVIDQTSVAKETLNSSSFFALVGQK